jgi:hypothetical protein
VGAATVLFLARGARPADERAAAVTATPDFRAVNAVGADPAPDDDGPGLPRTSDIKLDGRTVAQFGPDLLGPDPAASLRAAKMLALMSPESVRWFRQGLRSVRPHVVENSVAHFPGETARRYVDEFEPDLLPLLTDPRPQVRRRAAVALLDLRSGTGAERVRQMARDPALPEDERRALTAALAAHGL